MSDLRNPFGAACGTRKAPNAVENTRNWYISSLFFVCAASFTMAFNNVATWNSTVSIILYRSFVTTIAFRWRKRLTLIKFHAVFNVYEIRRGFHVKNSSHSKISKNFRFQSTAISAISAILDPKSMSVSVCEAAPKRDYEIESRVYIYIFSFVVKSHVRYCMTFKSCEHFTTLFHCVTTTTEIEKEKEKEREKPTHISYMTNLIWSNWITECFCFFFPTR